MDGVITTLYSLGATITAISYVPQIWSLLNDRTTVDSMSLKTYALWLYATFVSMLYAVCVNGDFFFILSTTTCFTGMAAITALIIFHRYIKVQHLNGRGMSAVDLMKAWQPLHLTPALVPVRASHRKLWTLLLVAAMSSPLILLP